MTNVIRPLACLSILLPVLVGCTKPQGELPSPICKDSGGNGQACGGGGDVLASLKLRAEKILTRYRSGVPTSFGRDYGDACRQRHTLRQCDRLLLSGLPGVETKLGVARAFMANRAAEYLTQMDRLPAKSVSGPLTIVQPPHGTRTVKARVLDGVMEFDEAYLLEASVHDLLALFIHEYGHLVGRVESSDSYGDFDVVADFGNGITFHDFLGAASVTDPFNTENPYRDLVLNEQGVVAFLPLFEAPGSLVATNLVTGRRHGNYDGGERIELGASGSNGFDSGIRLNRQGVNGGAITFDLEDSRADVMTVEFWMLPDNSYGNLATRAMVFGFGSYGLFTMDRSFGFNTGAGDIDGVESTNLLNRWVHVAAVFHNKPPSPTDPVTPDELYINGVSMPVLQRRSTRNQANAIIQRTLSFSGSPNSGLDRFVGGFDELALYQGALPPTRIAEHFAVGSGRKVIKGSKMMTLLQGTSLVEGSVALSEPCPAKEIITSANPSKVIVDTIPVSTRHLVSVPDPRDENGFKYTVKTDPTSPATVGPASYADVSVRLDYIVLCR